MKAYMEWMSGNDTGTSSKTIMAVMTDTKPKYADTPCDPSDFGRCHRLLEQFPEFKPRLEEVAKRYPKWIPLVKKWDEFTEIYLRDLPTGASEELYKKMKDIGL